jgi:hypothetical protein
MDDVGESGLASIWIKFAPSFGMSAKKKRRIPIGNAKIALWPTQNVA